MVGNIPNFTKIDILRCFLRFNKKLGRQELTKELELGEGTIRTILNILKYKNLINSTKKGHFLSKTGRGLLDEILNNISIPKVVTSKSLYPNFKKIGVVVRNTSDLKGLYKLRDIAVKNGAEGAVILRYENKLYAPESSYEQNYKELEEYFDFENNDVLVISLSNKNRNAENGALAIAIELNNLLKKFINEF